MNAAGTPNFLRDLSLQCYQGSWTDMMQGGLDQAQFDCRMLFEDTLDLVAGNLVVYGQLGSALSANANNNDTSVTVTGLKNVQVPAFLDIIKGDQIMISDGTNMEQFVVQSVTGNGPWTINLNGAWSSVQIATQTTLSRGCAAGATTVFVQSGNGLSASQHIVIGNDAYTIGAGYGGGTSVPITGGTSNAYSAGTPISLAGTGVSKVYVTTANGITVGTNVWFDSGSDLLEEGNSIAGKPASDGNVGQPVTLTNPLTNGHGAGAPMIFQMPGKLLNSYTAGQTVVVRVQYVGYISQRIHSTQRPAQLSLACQGYFSSYQYLIDSSTVQDDGATLTMKRFLSSYASTRPGIIVNNSQGGTWLASSNGVRVNIQETDSQLLNLIDDILRQENGSSIDVQYAVWVGLDRIVRHLPIATAPHYTSKVIGGRTYSTPTYHLKLNDQSGDYGDTIDSLQITDEDITGLVNAAVVTGTNAPQGSGISNQNETTLGQAYVQPHNYCVVTATPTSWPSSSNGGLYVLIDRGSSNNSNVGYRGFQGTTVQMAGSFPSGKGYPVGTKVDVVTKLTSAHSSGDTQFAVGNAAIFSSGQEVTITPTGATEESLTIGTVNYGTNRITTTTACKKAHGSGDIVCLAANGSGSGPRILVEQTDSIKQFGWFEGTLNSSDIYNEKQLAQWAARQLSITAWPKVASQVQLSTTAARINGRDLVEIAGFSDKSRIAQNVSKVQYNATAADMNISATLDLAVLYKTSGKVMGEIANERAQRIKYHIPVHHGNKTGHAHGHQVNQSGPNQVTIEAGAVKVAGNLYQVPALTVTVPDGESRWGASAGPGVATPAIIELPKRLWNGRSVYANTVYLIDQQGDDPQVDQTFTGVPLWKIQSHSGKIVGLEPLFTSHGQGLTELPSVTAPAAPTISGFTYSTISTGNGISGDIPLSGSITNFPTDGGTHSIKVYVRTTGEILWQHKLTLRPPDLPQPSITQTVSTLIHGLPLGASVDIGISHDGFNGESAITTIVTGFVLPPTALVTAPIMSGTAAPTGVGGGASPTPSGGAGTLYVRTATGVGLNAKLYVYDEVVGWKPFSLTFN